MCLIDDADGKWDELEPLHMVRARKAHVCGECGREIAVGEHYETGSFASDYGIDTVRTCAHCRAVRSWLVEQCGGWLYRGVLEDLDEHWAENWELRGRYLARAIAGMRKRWKNRDGSLMRPMGVYKLPAMAQPGTLQ